MCVLGAPGGAAQCPGGSCQRAWAGQASSPPRLRLRSLLRPGSRVGIAVGVFLFLWGVVQQVARFILCNVSKAQFALDLCNVSKALTRLAPAASGRSTPPRGSGASSPPRPRTARAPEPRAQRRVRSFLRRARQPACALHTF